jgi:hypothetical protein
VKIRQYPFLLLLVIIILIFESSTHAIGFFNQDFINDLNKLKSLNLLSPQTIEGVGYFWNNPAKPADSPNIILLKEKKYFTDSLAIFSTMIFDKKSNKHMVHYLFLSLEAKTPRDFCERVYAEIKTLLGSEYKTIDYGFLKYENPISNTNSASVRFRKIKQDYIINNLRYRFLSYSTLMPNGDTAYAVNTLSVYEYNKSEDLKDLIILRFFQKTVKNPQTNAIRDETIPPYVIIVDFNDNEILDNIYSLKGKIVYIDNTLVKAEYELNNEKTIIIINRTSNMFSIEKRMINANTANIYEGTYERVDINKPTF